MCFGTGLAHTTSAVVETVLDTVSREDQSSEQGIGRYRRFNRLSVSMSHDRIWSCDSGRRSSEVEHTLGKGGAESSILSGGTNFPSKCGASQKRAATVYYVYGL